MKVTYTVGGNKDKKKQISGYEIPPKGSERDVKSDGLDSYR